jgi:predicted nucleic acid-binding Zn ribbon protein
MAPTKTAGVVTAESDNARIDEHTGSALVDLAIQSPQPNQGAHYECATCGAPLDIKHNGRPRRFCSDRCWDAARRNRNFRVSGRARYPSQGVPGNPRKTQAKSTICEGTSATPRSPVIRVSGVGICTVPQRVGDAVERRKLTATAVRTEIDARWRRGAR